MDFRAMTDDERWEAVQARDKAQDGRFVTGVLTTGIYCRPSCAARHPLRQNVRFFADGDAARVDRRQFGIAHREQRGKAIGAQPLDRIGHHIVLSLG